MQYVAFLRGINVSGQKIIKMAELRKLLAENGFNNVKTYIQSGNILFESSKKDQLKIEEEIQSCIKKNFGFHVHVMVLTLNKIKNVVDNCPFDFNELGDNEMIYFSLLDKVPESKNIENLLNTTDPTDKIIVMQKTAYIHCKRGFSKTTFTNNFIEKILDVNATTRNLNTMKKMIFLAQ